MVATFCADLRTFKGVFTPATLLALAQEISASELGKQSSTPLVDMGDLLTQVAQDIHTALTAASEGEQVMKR
jgi:hypothetical protein